MATAFEVAKYLLQLAARDEEGEPMTQMRLHKLLYYVQGWALGIRKCPMFSESIEAWIHGPVVPSLRPRLQAFGHGAIPADALGPDPVKLGESDKAFVLSVWTGYSKFSAAGLRNMTHDESPWIEARRGYAPTDRCSEEISVDVMRETFEEHFLSGLSSEFDAKALALADLQHAEGDTFGMEEFEGLLAQ